MKGNGDRGSSSRRPRSPLSVLASTLIAALNGGRAETSARKAERTSANEGAGLVGQQWGEEKEEEGEREDEEEQWREEEGEDDDGEEEDDDGEGRETNDSDGGDDEGGAGRAPVSDEELGGEQLGVTSIASVDGGTAISSFPLLLILRSNGQPGQDDVHCSWPFLSCTLRCSLVLATKTASRL